MSVRRWPKSSSKSKKRRTQRREEIKHRMQLEKLEDRQLLATGPRLAGILANDGALLTADAIRDVAPKELVFRFNEGQTIDPATLSGIEITRSGFDGTFARSSITSDFNTNGAVVIQLQAVNAGPGGDHISLAVTKSDHGDGSGPTITVAGSVINVDLNTNALNHTNANELVDAINNSAAASALVTASITGGFHFQDLTVPVINYSPLQLQGYNAAMATSDLGTNTNVQVKFQAAQPGLDGNGIKIQFTKSNHALTGKLAGPTINVTGKLISVDLDTNPLNQTTITQFVNAINSYPAASQLVRVSVPVGDPTLNIANRVIDYSPITLTGSSDVTVEPGFIGIGEFPNQVIARFKETLPDDHYLISIFGSGPTPLRNSLGEAFNDLTDDDIDFGTDFNGTFQLDLGAQII